jgi:uncharacterized phage protein gp47/JayE
MSDIFNYRSPDQILTEMIRVFQALQPEVSVNEVSTLYFLFQVYSVTASQNMDLAQDFFNAAFLTTAEGDDLTNLAADRGVTRKAAVSSQVILELSRAVASASPVTIPVSSSFSTEPDQNGQRLVFQNFDEATIPALTTSVTALAGCQTSGEIGNIPADTITNFITFLGDVDTVTNPASAYGGVDEETDEALRERTTGVLEDNTGKVTVSGYKQSLESFSGVLSATVIAGSGAMPNYITAIVTTDASDDGIPTATQLATWNALINSDDYRAVVDVITVVAPVSVPITVNAEITSYTPDSDEAETIARVQQSVIDYINGLSPGDTVRVVDISNQIHDDGSVLDFTLTDPSTNTALTNLQKATASTATVTIT